MASTARASWLRHKLQPQCLVLALAYTRGWPHWRLSAACRPHTQAGRLRKGQLLLRCLAFTSSAGHNSAEQPEEVGAGCKNKNVVFDGSASSGIIWPLVFSTWILNLAGKQPRRSDCLPGAIRTKGRHWRESRSHEKNREKKEKFFSRSRKFDSFHFSFYSRFLRVARNNSLSTLDFREWQDKILFPLSIFL